MPNATPSRSNQEYFNGIFRELTQKLTSIHSIKEFTNNPELIGNYAESVIRNFITQFVHPLRVSSGSIISPESYPEGKILPQLDAIIWSPNPLPALFQAGNFALIPKRSVYGILEIKSSYYLNSEEKVEKLKEKLEDGEKYIPLLYKKASAERPSSEISRVAIGVIPIKLEGQTTNEAIERLRRERKVVVLIDQTIKEKERQIQNSDMRTLINFLVGVRLRAKAVDTRVYLNNL